MINDKLSEKVFDSLVEELVTGQHPPDLTSRILSAWRQEQIAGKSIPMPEIRAKPIGPKSLVVHRIKFFWVAAAAACMLLAVVGWRWRSSPPGRQSQMNAQGGLDSGLSENSRNAKSPDVDSSLLSASSSSLADSSPVPATDEITSQKRETIETIASPFALDADLVINPSSDVSTLANGRDQLTSTEIVEELDRLMNELWHSLDVAPTSSSPPVELAQRTAILLTGQVLSDSQLGELIDSKKQLLDRARLISSASDSIAFDRSWSQRLVQLWLGRSTQGEAESIFVDALANRMGLQKQWNSIVAELIGGELKDDSLSNQFLSLLAGGENHRLIECIGKNFLNQQVTCVRCHKSPDSGSAAFSQQGDYWSLIALFKGVESQGPNRLVMDRQSRMFTSTDSKRSNPAVYFELPNGALKQAFARLPDGRDWYSNSASIPRESLANWISDSSEFDRATVNMTWQLIFGRPLVPLVPTIDAVSLEYRERILNFLAGQFDSADHDFKRLVGWIVSSRSFASQPSLLSREQWQQASEPQLESQQLKELVFANGAKLGILPDRRRLQENLKFVVQWRAASKPNTLLAQPAQLEPGQRASAQSKADSPFSADFAVHGLRPTNAQQTYIDRLLRAEKLTWATRVQHVVGLSSVGLANDDLQYVAKELLQQHNGDTRLALLDLLWAVQASQL